MKTVQVQKLTLESFRKYGAYQDVLRPEGESIGAAPAEFFRDMLQLRLGGTDVISFSVLELTKRPFVINALEYHNRCCEGMLPVDADIIVQLAPPCSGEEIPYDRIEAFLVPKGTAIILNPGVWHESPYLAEAERGHIFCMLPERTYMNDAHLIRIPEDRQLLVEI